MPRLIVLIRGDLVCRSIFFYRANTLQKSSAHIFVPNWYILDLALCLFIPVSIVLSYIQSLSASNINT